MKYEPEHCTLLKIMKRRIQRLSVCLLFFISLPIILLADSLNVTSFGKLIVSNFSPNYYQAENQNWDICEGDNGLMYFANGPLLEGGSDYWQQHYLKEETFIRSVQRMDSSRIMIGANQEMGYFTRFDIPGRTEYTSLMGKLDTNYHSFGSIWQILKYEEAYYLRAGRGLFKYEKDTVIPLLYGDVVDYIRFLDDSLFVLIAGKGLGIYNDDGFHLLAFGSYFADKRIVAMTSYTNNGEYLIFTDDEGIYRSDGNEIWLFHAFNHREIIESQISSVILLNNQYFAVGTVRDGLYILDLSGSVIQHLNIKNGLQNNTIISMFADSSNNIWLGLDYGISYVYLNSCISIINSESDIGTGYVSKYYKDKLYLGTNQGLYYIDWSPQKQKTVGDMQILPVMNSSGQVWGLHISDGILFCNHHEGLFKIEGDHAILLSPLEGSWQIDPLKTIPGCYLQSTYRGFFLYRLLPEGELELIKEMDQIEASRLFYQDDKGYIWNVASNNRLFRYKIDPENLEIEEKVNWGSKQGLPVGRIGIVGSKKQLIFTTEKGFYTYDDARDRFESREYYNDLFGAGNLMLKFFKDDYDRIWYVTQEEIGYFSLHFGQMEKVTSPFNLVSKSYNRFFGEINVIDRENIFFAMDRGYYHFNAACSSKQNKQYRCYIIDLNTTSPPIKSLKANRARKYPVYSHKKNSFEFVLTSNIIESQENIQYAFILDGYDDNWSEWSNRNRKEYNNLFGGVYTFRVRAKDGSGLESSEASFAFQVKPPVYRSVTAYITYIVLLVLIVLIISNLRTKKIEKEKLKIENRKQQELEDKRKKYEEGQMKSKQRITELLNEKLQQDLRHKSGELSNSMINILHKNEIMLNLKKEMQNLYMEKNLEHRDLNIKKLIRMIENEISTKKDLEVFDANFNAVHEEFLKNLKDKYPALNQNDHRMCTFIKMNKSTKEIATFLNLSIRGVETSRYRLRKKMNLEGDDNLYDIISSI